MRELQVRGDASRLVTDATKTQYPAIPWRAIAGMRNRIVHACFDVRLAVLWDTIQYEIPIRSHDLAQIVTSGACGRLMILRFISSIASGSPRSSVPHNSKCSVHTRTDGVCPVRTALATPADAVQCCERRPA